MHRHRAEPALPGTGEGPAPLLLALVAQGIGGLLTLCAVLLADVLGTEVPAPMLLHGLAAALAGHRLGLPGWWLPINFAFVPGALWLQEAELGRSWFLAAFLLLLTLFWNTFSGRVPLYLTGTPGREALAALLPPQRPFRLLDVGCGFGGLLVRLAPRFPEGRFHGVELAPLSAAIARLRAAFSPGCEAARRDLWSTDLAGYDVVYAFLSPVPMPRLWDKALAEMDEGSLLVSNTFPVPGVAPTRVIPLPGLRTSALYLYRMPGPMAAPAPCPA